MDEYKHRYLQVRANRCQISNNFRTLTMDMTNTEPCNFSLMQQLSRASSGVYRLNVRLQSMATAVNKLSRPSDASDVGDARFRLIKYANEWIRTPGRLVSVTTGDAPDEWFWERDDLNCLDLGLAGKSHRKDVPAEGHMSLEDRIAGPRRFLKD